MERLTERFENGQVGVAVCGKNCKHDHRFCENAREDCPTFEDIYEKLATYEDAEEQGLLLRLPCKEAYSQSGDYVYLIYDDEVIECTHCGLSINPVDGKAYIALAADEDIFPYRRPDPEHDLDPTDWCTHATDVEVNEIGKTLFFTREEAKVKLKELRGGENER